MPLNCRTWRGISGVPSSNPIPEENTVTFEESSDSEVGPMATENFFFFFFFFFLFVATENMRIHRSFSNQLAF